MPGLHKKIDLKQLIFNALRGPKGAPFKCGIRFRKRRISAPHPATISRDESTVCNLPRTLDARSFWASYHVADWASQGAIFVIQPRDFGISGASRKIRASFQTGCGAHG